MAPASLNGGAMFIVRVIKARTAGMNDVEINLYYLLDKHHKNIYQMASRLGKQNNPKSKTNIEYMKPVAK